MSKLLPFIILYTDETFNVPEGALFEAEDSEHAEEQFENAYPTATVIWVVETDDINEAFKDYHNE